MRDRLARNCRLTAVSTQVYNAIKGWIEGDRDAENEDGNGFSMDAMLDGAGGGADSARTRRPEAAETAPGDGDEALGDLTEESLASFRAVEEDSVGLGPKEDGAGGVGVVTANECKMFGHIFFSF